MIQLAKTFSKAWWLTTGADTFVGGASGDEFNALTVDASGNAASTLTAFDSIDGGAGNDTLNIYTDTAAAVTAGNQSVPSNLTVKNVETINFNNAGITATTGIVASSFVGATAINQIGTAAAAVTQLAATTTAGFNGVVGGLITVTAATTAATAKVALTNVVDAITGVTVAGDALNAVTVTGNVVASDAVVGLQPVTLTVNAGKTVESVTINTAVASDLNISNVAGSSKTVSSVDASASTGSINYVAQNTIASIKTGAGNDTATLATSLNATVKAASISTGAGNDKVTVTASLASAAAGQTVTVDAGAGNDEIQLTVDTRAAYNVTAGAGDDQVVLLTSLESALVQTIGGVVSTSNVKIDGGAGTDTLHVVDATLSATAYERLAVNVTGFETIAFDNAATAIAADKLSQFSTLGFDAGGVVTGVAAAQTLVAEAALTATAAGYVAAVDADTPAVYAGTLNIQATGAASQSIVANANVVNLTVAADAVTGNAANAVLSGDYKTLNATVQSVHDLVDGVADGSESLGTLSAVGAAALESATVTGAGVVTITGAALTTIDVSGVTAFADLNGDGTAGTEGNLSTTTITGNTLAQTIKLGGAKDTVNVVSSVDKLDTITGFSLVADADNAEKADANLSDALQIGNDTFAAVTIEATNNTFTLALDQVAKSAVDNALFVFEGNTYAYVDSTPALQTDTYAAGDTLVQLTGVYNLDQLASVITVAA